MMAKKMMMMNKNYFLLNSFCFLRKKLFLVSLFPIVKKVTTICTIESFLLILSYIYFSNSFSM